MLNEDKILKNQQEKLDALALLAGHTAHDFNNVLSIIHGYVRLLKQSPEDISKNSEYLSRIEKSIERGTMFTKQLSVISHRHIDKEKSCELSAAVKKIQQVLEPQVHPDTSLNISANEKARILCDHEDFVQIIVHLFVNAQDALDGLDGKGKIDITMQPVHKDEIPSSAVQDSKADGQFENFMHIAVSDNGCGMNMETYARIFDPFFSDKENDDRSGLGLSIVYGLVQKSGGYIHVETEERKGTKISVFLPVLESLGEVEQDSIAIGQIEEEKTLEDATILVVDDKVDLLDTLAALLENEGMTVLKASSGTDALIVQEDFPGPIDFMLTDIMMAGMDGIKTAELLKELRPDTKILYMSGYSGGKRSELDIPREHFLEKPIETSKLIELLRKFLNTDDQQCDARMSPLSNSAKESQRGKPS